MSDSSAVPDLPPESPHAASLPSVTPDVIEQDFPEMVDNAVPTHGYYVQPMIGLGGSAGSIQALRRFFQLMPVDSGFVFVVILHLAPDMDSILPELLARETKMPVMHAVDGHKVQPDCVYVIPPGQYLITVDGHLRLRKLEPERGRRVAVDLFFRSLADTHGPHATAVILSGADGDGTIGIKRIKERGGLTIAQDPEEAEFPDMPASAVSTGMVDWILRTAEIPQRLVDYYANELLLELPPEEEPTTRATTDEESEEALREVLAFLKMQTGRDFMPYKRATVVRRLSRRMQVNGVLDLRSYLQFMRTHHGETGALVQDLLISVTNFFRDRESFEALGWQIPTLFQGRNHADTIRAWVPGCATGEEAISVAILLAEYAATVESPPSLQVFASDLDDKAIQTARAGLYPLAITADVSEERLRRFFIREAGGYRIRREIREMVLFTTHDLLNDVPFARMDMVTCRNLLIYLRPEGQQRAMDIFDFSLNPGGLLFLGGSESVDESNLCFTVLDKKSRIYRHQSVKRKASAGVLAFSHPMTPPPSLPVVTYGARRREIPLGPGPGPGLGLSRFGVGGEFTPSEQHVALLEQSGLASILVDGNQEILHLTKGASRFLEYAAGEPTVNLLRLVHPALRVELRAALLRVMEVRQPIEICGVPATLGEVAHRVDLRVYPGGERGQELVMVVLSAQPEKECEGQGRPTPDHEPLAENLERELDRITLSLRDTVEEYEANLEELKANNEELQAMNEELRAATEELETSREELQSINEELTTVNHELKQKVDELGHANSDLNNLMAATAIATVFLDKGLCITRYTPPAVNLFNLIPGDVGRPLHHLKNRLDYPLLTEDAEQVLERLMPVEREVRTAESRWFLARLLPYRTTDDFIGGVVLTFVDITDRRRTEAALAESQGRLQLIVENARDFAIFSMDLERRVISWNMGAHQILGYTEPEILGNTGDVIFTEEDRKNGAPEREYATAMQEGRATDERWHVRKDGSRFWGSGSLMSMHDGTGRVVGLVKIFRDQTEALRAKEDLIRAAAENERARREAEAAGIAKDDFLASLSHELRTPLNPALMTVATLETDSSIPEPVRVQLRSVKRNIELEARLIDDLLDITRISRGKIALDPGPCDLHDLLERAAEIVLCDMPDDRISLALETEARQHWVKGEPARLQQILWNLLKNAFKFTQHGGTVTVRTSNPAPGLVMVAVTDSGIGIDPGCLERIFQPFDQGTLLGRHRFGGLGLGLSISKALAEMHGGRLWACSEGIGKGATFLLELATTPPESIPEALSADPEVQYAVNPLRLLVVEDHHPTLHAMQWLLEREGHTVFPATTVKEALAVADREPCDLLISDIGLPDSSGLDLMREIKRLHGWPGIALSGYGMQDDLTESLEAGFLTHLTKPIRIAQLRRAIQQVLQPASRETTT